jgi:hypothetical protein
MGVAMFPVDCPQGGISAAAVVARAIKSGLLRAASEFACSDCGKPAQQYDHRDYNKPLNVDPVCRSCNQLRGPAMPVHGYFRHMFETRHTEYGSRKRMKQLLSVVGIEADLTDLPGRVRFKHWLPYKDALLAWESQWTTDERSAVRKTDDRKE